MHADTDEADVDDDGEVVFGSGLVLLALCVVSCLLIHAVVQARTPVQDEQNQAYVEKS
jgi:hypothetical protein